MHCKTNSDVLTYTEAPRLAGGGKGQHWLHPGPLALKDPVLSATCAQSQHTGVCECYQATPGPPPSEQPPK